MMRCITECGSYHLACTANAEDLEPHSMSAKPLPGTYRASPPGHGRLTRSPSHAMCRSPMLIAHAYTCPRRTLVLCVVRPRRRKQTTAPTNEVRLLVRGHDNDVDQRYWTAGPPAEYIQGVESMRA
ncbi:hypothetical protein NEOLEDRAFT_315210 [Neolentinus lepideus HHB14362 ss-1]|uniref:Uncharacterized protein n=1 Tax=Neolentinus lepideus HHB14362 ss-1 TaxID=1314782 RepID=A0A165VTT7_9AGAM|nr:hypothetical protein NEOLEDRAFT_315210 [Neolentinus lepideus HHB14362 ss-1]